MDYLLESSMDYLLESNQSCRLAADLCCLPSFIYYHVFRVFHVFRFDPNLNHCCLHYHHFVGSAYFVSSSKADQASFDVHLSFPPL